jgi:3-oxoacyl-[acyl-carrier-protein] synthase-1
MSRALAASGLRAEQIDYINLHGTATRVGDAAEDQAVVSLFGNATPCSSTKGHTGHTLGASGITEVVIAALSIIHGLLPGSPHTRTRDPHLRCGYVTASRPARINRVLTNSFGFGGSNASLILGTAG